MGKDQDPIEEIENRCMLEYRKSNVQRRGIVERDQHSASGGDPERSTRRAVRGNGNMYYYRMDAVRTENNKGK